MCVCVCVCFPDGQCPGLSDCTWRKKVLGFCMFLLTTKCINHPNYRIRSVRCSISSWPLSFRQRQRDDIKMTVANYGAHRLFAWVCISTEPAHRCAQNACIDNHNLWNALALRERAWGNVECAQNTLRHHHHTSDCVDDVFSLRCISSVRVRHLCLCKHDFVEHLEDWEIHAAACGRETWRLFGGWTNKFNSVRCFSNGIWIFFRKDIC